MSIFIKVHKWEFLRIITKVQKEVKQWVRAKCEHEGILQQGYNLPMIKQENTTKWDQRGPKTKCLKHHKRDQQEKDHQEHHKKKHPRGRLGWRGLEEEHWKHHKKD